MSLPSADNRGGGSGVVELDVVAVHRTQWLLRTNASVPRRKS
jgi:hypothetical protein